MPVALGENGFPILLADVPNAGRSNIDPNATSGNPAHDVRSGKFGETGGGKKKETPPANTDPLEYHRMLDAVRDAARQFDTLDEASISDFLKGRAKFPEAVNLQQFMQAVIEQRKTDLVDMISEQLRGGPKRKVKMTVPRGFLKKALTNADPGMKDEIMQRLIALGHAQATVRKFFETE